jgi:hypothetical protein
MEQLKDIMTAIAVKPKTHMHRDQVSKKKIKQVSDSVHTGDLSG